MDPFWWFLSCSSCRISQTRLHRKKRRRRDGGDDGGGAVGVGGGAPSPTQSSAFVSPLFKSEIEPLIAVLSNSLATLEAFVPGLSSTSAAPPETWGHAMDVPLRVLLPPSES